MAIVSRRFSTLGLCWAPDVAQSIPTIVLEVVSLKVRLVLKRRKTDVYATPGEEDIGYILRRPQRPVCKGYETISKSHSDSQPVLFIIIINGGKC